MLVKLTEDEWLEQYKPIPNTVPGGTNGECGLNIDGVGYMFETYGPDLDFVRAQPNENIWTIIENDDKGFLCEGYHLVDRIGYLISTVPALPGTEYSILLYQYDEENNYENVLDNSDGDALASAGHGTDEDYPHETI